MAFSNTATYERKRDRLRVRPPFGISRGAWPFIKALIASSFCGFAFFVIARLTIDWDPQVWDIADRLALVIQSAIFAVLPAVVAIVVVALQRLRSDFFVGTEVRAYSPLDINTRFVQNTIEQSMLFLVGISGLALYVPPEDASAVPILAALFLLGRTIFWVGYHKNPQQRAFGFGLTFYPTLIVYAWLLVRMLTGIYIPI